MVKFIDIYKTPINYLLLFWGLFIYHGAHMKVGKDKVVLMHYTLKNDAGNVIDSSDGADPLPFLQGHGNIIPGLEKALEGSKVVISWMFP